MEPVILGRKFKMPKPAKAEAKAEAKARRQFECTNNAKGIKFNLQLCLTPSLLQNIARIRTRGCVNKSCPLCHSWS